LSALQQTALSEPSSILSPFLILCAQWHFSSNKPHMLL
jgi:hypothetical protein